MAQSTQGKTLLEFPETGAAFKVSQVARSGQAFCKFNCSYLKSARSNCRWIHCIRIFSRLSLTAMINLLIRVGTPLQVLTSDSARNGKVFLNDSTFSPVVR
jgi:hypothetical protein